jgi:hypothetical protein
MKRSDFKEKEKLFNTFFHKLYCDNDVYRGLCYFFQRILHGIIVSK